MKNKDFCVRREPERWDGGRLAHPAATPPLCNGIGIFKRDTLALTRGSGEIVDPRTRREPERWEGGRLAHPAAQPPLCDGEKIFKKDKHRLTRGSG
ncbi:MAG: hypothetical protein Q4G69_09400, partial [Planctomycetia bacterium]|nr:hypothetical protein [Planctomycetia bacterium]